MATSGSNRDVTLTLSVETLGEDNVKKLQSSVLALAKEGGAAAPEFQRLADEIGRLGDQNEALQSFKALGAETDVLRQRQETAATSVEAMRAALEPLRVATDAARAKQVDATQALLAGQTAYVEAGNAIRVLKTEYDSAGKNTDAYRSRLNALTVEQGEAKTALIGLRQSQKDANSEVGAAESAQGKLESAYKKSAAQAERTSAALLEQEAALRQAAVAATALGVSTEDVAAAEAGLLTALASTVATATAKAASTREMAEADRLLAIEQQTMITLIQRGEQALQAETLAQRDAARSVAEYEAAKAAATAQSAAWQKEADQIVETAHATATLARETQVLVAASQVLASQRAFEQQAADAQKLIQAADYVRFWENALQTAETQATETATAAAAAAAKIDNAFSTLGVKSAQQLEMEIQQVRAAMATVAATAGVTGGAVAGAFTAGEAKIKALEREMRELNGTLTTGDRLANLFKNSLGQIAAGNLVADGVGYLINKVKEMGREFIIAIVQLDQMSRGLNAIYQDARVTANQIAFLRKTASDAGVSFGGLSSEFVKFTASMKGANVPLEQSNALFKAVVQASATLGLGAEATAGSLNALGQMASKGVVSMEELRQQLGDRLPGAFGLVAQGLGVTEAQLVKLVESGNLAARDLFPALTKALGQMKGETDGLVPTWERLKGLFTESAQSAGDAGVYVLLNGVLKVLGGTVGALALGLSVLVEGMFLTGAAATALAARLSGDAKAFDFFTEQVEKSTARLASQAAAFNNFLAPQKQYTEGQTAAAAALGTTAAAAVSATAALDASSKVMGLHALATKLAADNTLDLSTKMVQFNVASAEVLAAQTKQTEASEKLAKAAKIEGDSLVDLARMRGDQQGILSASIAAAEKYSAAMKLVADNHKAESDILTLQITQLDANAKARGLTAEAIKVERGELEKKLTAAQAEAEQSKQSAEAARQEVVQRNLVADTYRDNSKKVDEYRKALDAANLVLGEYSRLALEGKKTDQEVAVVRERAAIAQALYTDATKDSAANIDRETRAKSANLSISQSKAGVEQQAYTIMAQSAKASGDYAMALYYEIEAKKAQMEATKASYAIKKLEAEADIKALDIQKLLIPVNDTARKQKMEEIDIRITLAKVKLAEAGAGDAIIRALENEVIALHQQRRARGDSKNAVDNDTASRDKNTDSINKQTAALKKHKLTSDGFATNDDGSAAGTFTNNLDLSAAFALIAKDKSGKLTAADLDAAKAAFGQAQGALDYMFAMDKLSPGSSSAAFVSSTNALYRGARAAYERVKTLAARENADAAKATPQTTPNTGTPAPAPAPAVAPTAKNTVTTLTGGPAATTTTVNITLDGKNYALPNMSTANADTLTAMLSALEKSARTSA